MRIFLLACVITLCQAAAHASEPADLPPFNIEHSAKAMRLCEKENTKRCVAFAMPDEAGKIVRVIHGNFLYEDIRTLSWIAFTSKNASMCFVPWMPMVVCAPIGTYPVDLTIHGPSYAKVNADLYFVHKVREDMMSPEHFRQAESFAQRAYAAADALQTFGARTLGYGDGDRPPGLPLAFGRFGVRESLQEGDHVWWPAESGQPDAGKPAAGSPAAGSPGADDGFSYWSWDKVRDSLKVEPSAAAPNRR